MEDNIRAFVDLKCKGNASGGKHFIRLDSLKESILKIEKDGLDRVVGIVYDESDNFEILTQPFQDLEKLDLLEGKNDSL
jgi:hypothetical protein